MIAIRIRRRAGRGVEVGRADGQLVAGRCLHAERIERSDEDDAEDRGQEEIVGDERAFAGSAARTSRLLLTVPTRSPNRVRAPPI
jgi:hypothetical protein